MWFPYCIFLFVISLLVIVFSFFSNRYKYIILQAYENNIGAYNRTLQSFKLYIQETFKSQKNIEQLPAVNNDYKDDLANMVVPHTSSAINENIVIILPVNQKSQSKIKNNNTNHNSQSSNNILLSLSDNITIAKSKKIDKSEFLTNIVVGYNKSSNYRHKFENRKLLKSCTNSPLDEKFFMDQMEFDDTV